MLGKDPPSARSACLPGAMLPLFAIRNRWAGVAASSAAMRSSGRAALTVTLLQQDRQRGLHAGDASPGTEKIARLHLGRRGRMIGRDDIHGAAEQLDPRARLVRRGSRRGGAHFAIAPSRSTSSSVKNR